MKNTLNVRLQPASLLLGLAVGVLAVVAMGQKPQNIRELVRIEYGPHPRDMVRVESGAPYTVPAGKLLVVTGLGHMTASSATKQAVSVQFNGTGVLAAWTRIWEKYDGITSLGVSGAGPAIPVVPPGLVAAAGTQVEVSGTGGGVLLGYLADA